MPLGLDRDITQALHIAQIDDSMKICMQEVNSMIAISLRMCISSSYFKREKITISDLLDSERD